MKPYLLKLGLILVAFLIPSADGLAKKEKMDSTGFHLVVSDNQSSTDNDTPHHTPEQDEDDDLKEKPPEYALIKRVLDNDDLGPTAEAELVSEIEATYSISVFVSALEESNWEYRGGAALVLGLLKNSQAVPALMDMATNDPNIFCQSSAAIALNKIDENGSKDKAWSILMKEVENPDIEPFKKSIIVMAMGELVDKRAMPYLVKLLKEKGIDSSVQQAAVRVVAKMEDPQATPALIGFASRQDIEPYVRNDALRILSASGSDEAIAFLLGVLNSQNYDDDTRLDVIDALGHTTNGNAISALIIAAKDGIPEVRFHAVVALGQIADGRAQKAIIDSLEDEEACIRMRAVMILGPIGDQEALSELEKKLDDDGTCRNKTVGDSARHSIKQIRERVVKNDQPF